jgi:4-oxalocrotonate tautomerase
MPLVHIDLMQGREPEQIEELIAAVSGAVSETLEAPLGTVRVVVNEMEGHQYGIGGLPYPEVKRRREAAARADQDGD